MVFMVHKLKLPAKYNYYNNYSYARHVNGLVKKMDSPDGYCPISYPEPAFPRRIRYFSTKNSFQLQFCLSNKKQNASMPILQTCEYRP